MTMKTPCPTRRKMGLMAAFMLIIVAFGAIPTTADENFGVGADVKIEVDRATDQPTPMPCETDPIYMIILGFWVGILITLLFAGIWKWRRRNATPCALPGGEMLG